MYGNSITVGQADLATCGICGALVDQIPETTMLHDRWHGSHVGAVKVLHGEVGLGEKNDPR